MGAKFYFFNFTNLVELILIVELTDSVDDSLFVDYIYSCSYLNFKKQSYIFSIKRVCFVFKPESQFPPVPDASS